MNTIKQANWTVIGTWIAFGLVVWPMQYGLVIALAMVALPLALFLALVGAWLAVRTARRNKMVGGAIVGGVLLNRAAERRHQETLSALKGPVEEAPPVERISRDWLKLARPVGLSYLRGLPKLTAGDRNVAIGLVFLVGVIAVIVG